MPTNIEHHPQVFAVSLGPGEAEQISLKAYRALQNSDVIYVPSTHNKSQALTILNQLNIQPPKICFEVPVHVGELKLKLAYEAVSLQIGKNCKEQKKVSVVTIGDWSLYSTIGQLLPFLNQQNVRVCCLAGVPSFLALAAASQQVLTLKDQSLLILSGFSENQLRQALSLNVGAVVLLKIKKDFKPLLTFLSSNTKKWQCIYAEHLGTELEWLSSDLKEITQRKPIYFSCMLLKPT